MKVKTEKKAPFIDMTAMSDVTVLLLTFFMLTSTFLQKEPATVITPASVSEEKVPEQNLVTLLITKDSQIFMSIAGDRDSTYSSEKMREEVLLNVVSEYNKKHPNKKIELTNADVATFGNTYMYGGGLLTAKIMCKLTGGKINPLIGSAGVSAVPMAARVANREGQKANPSNFLLMHAMGPNVAGVIGSAIAAGFLLSACNYLMALVG